MQTSREGKAVASCKNQTVQEVLRKHDINPANHNARQCFQQVRANKQAPHLALPYRCRRPAPKDINVYNDGGWIFPLQQYLGLGGGVRGGLVGIPVAAIVSAKLSVISPTPNNILRA